MNIRKYTRRLARSFWESKVYWTLRRLYVPLSRILIDRPIFILGTQGGGNTLVYRVLARHPSMVGIAGNHRYWTRLNEMHNSKPWYQFNKLKGLDKAFLPEELAITRKEEHPIFGYHKYWIYATDSLYDEYRLTENDYDAESANLLRGRIKIALRAYAKDIRSARFVDKSPTYSLKIPFLRKCLCNPLFILLLRNPYAMCWLAATRVYEKEYESRVDIIGRYHGPWNVKMSLDERLKFAGQHWVNTFQTALSELQNADDGYILRFEDLLVNPKRKLMEILEFVELEYFPYLLPRPQHQQFFWNNPGYRWYPLWPDVNNKCFKEITPEAVEIIHNYAGVLADRFGYERPR